MVNRGKWLPITSRDVAWRLSLLIKILLKDLGIRLYSEVVISLYFDNDFKIFF